MRGRNLFFFVLGAGIVATGLWGLSVGALTNFTAGTAIKASEVNGNFTVLRNAIEALEQPVGVSRLAIGGTIGNGKVLKAQDGNLVWGDDAGGTAFGTSLEGSSAPVQAGFKVRNNGPLSIGVLGEIPGTGWAVRGVSSNDGIGVEGESLGGSGAGVSAKATATGTALLIDGSIGVRGNAPAFVHSATAGNINASRTTLDNPMTNGDPNAMLTVTPVSNDGDPFINAPIGVSYDSGTSRWRIFRADGDAMPVGAKFNVLVIKQR